MALKYVYFKDIVLWPCWEEHIGGRKNECGAVMRLLPQPKEEMMAPWNRRWSTMERVEQYRGGEMDRIW